eukprot:TRINITY_DN1971_c0_g2_i1.p1 TRINITY_DN1971_c0_g2~~TRINITY_DN1971_c0_g2_i1.p1  ORF type:complete len:117 (-),score=2.74 TRINITY_DN1971_c0_g2_i1:64-381(-)
MSSSSTLTILSIAILLSMAVSCTALSFSVDAHQVCARVNTSMWIPSPRFHQAVVSPPPFILCYMQQGSLTLYVHESTRCGFRPLGSTRRLFPPHRLSFVTCNRAV